jgi:hypothetical protein
MAIETNKNLLNLQRETSNISGMRDACLELKGLYDIQSDYRLAYFYNNLYDEYAKKINDQAREDDMAMMKIDNDRKEKDRIEQELIQIKKQKFNSQYTLIAIIIFTLFIGLAMMGLYKVSRRTVRLLGFFSFLLLFEYITLMSKKWVSHYTEGTPWQDFLFMILLALIMLPLHNWLEHQVIDYLTSKDLLKHHKSVKTPIPIEEDSETSQVVDKGKEEAPIRKITS